MKSGPTIVLSSRTTADPLHCNANTMTMGTLMNKTHETSTPTLDKYQTLDANSALHTRSTTHSHHASSCDMALNKTKSTGDIQLRDDNKVVKPEQPIHRNLLSVQSSQMHPITDTVCSQKLYHSCNGFNQSVIVNHTPPASAKSVESNTLSSSKPHSDDDNEEPDILHQTHADPEFNDVDMTKPILELSASKNRGRIRCLSLRINLLRSENKSYLTIHRRQSESFLCQTDRNKITNNNPPSDELQLSEDLSLQFTAGVKRQNFARLHDSSDEKTVATSFLGVTSPHHATESNFDNSSPPCGCQDDSPSASNVATTQTADNPDRLSNQTNSDTQVRVNNQADRISVPLIAYRSVNSPQSNSTTSLTAAAADPRSRTCCFCWCCCCSCSCMRVRTSLPDSKRPSASNDPQSRLDVLSLHEQLTHDEIQSWADSFDLLMKCPFGQKVFQEFLRSEYSEENILFWLACEDLKHETNAELVEEKARMIYDDYISILSLREVSLDSRVREIINANMIEPSPNTFDEAQLQIYTLMHRDSYLRFLSSPIYKDLLLQSGSSPNPSIS